MSRKAVIIFGSIAAVAVILWLIGITGVSEETRVRWALEKMCEAFNNERAGSTAAGFAEEFEVRNYSLTRDDVQSFLFGHFMSAQGKEPFPYRAEILEDTLRIQFEESEEQRARVTFDYRFLKLFKEEWTPQKMQTADLRLEKIDGDWLIIEVNGELDRTPF
jgi:hypothetical protein